MVDSTQLVEQLAKLLMSKQQFLTVAESCTGGGLAKICTDLAGSSAWFERGFVTYSNMAKVEMLAVKQTTLDQYGAVSKETVLEMAQGALQHSQAQCAIAISGVAGPDGGTVVNPVGSVWFAWQQEGQTPFAEKCSFDGNREQVRTQAISHALTKLLEYIS